MLQRTAGWSPQMLGFQGHLWVAAEKPSFMRRSRARDLGPQLLGGAVLLISMFPRVYIEPATQ